MSSRSALEPPHPTPQSLLTRLGHSAPWPHTDGPRGWALSHVCSLSALRAGKLREARGKVGPIPCAASVLRGVVSTQRGAGVAAFTHLTEGRFSCILTFHTQYQLPLRSETESCLSQSLRKSRCKVRRNVLGRGKSVQMTAPEMVLAAVTGFRASLKEVAEAGDGGSLWTDWRVCTLS